MNPARMTTARTTARTPARTPARRSGPRVLAATAALLGVVVVAACSDDPAPEPTAAAPATSSAPASASPSPSATASPGPSPAASGSPSPSPTGGPFAGFGTGPVSSRGFPDAGGDLGLGTAVRVGRHERWDRVVYEFSGPGPVGYRVRYVDEPVADGSGDTVAVEGDSYLEVLVSGLGYPEGDEQPPPDVPAGALRGTVLAEARALFAGFEGMGQVFVGVEGGKRSFRVTTLTNPTRLVVDVAR